MKALKFLVKGSSFSTCMCVLWSNKRYFFGRFYISTKWMIPNFKKHFHIVAISLIPPLKHLFGF